MRAVVLLSRKPRLYAAAADWDLPDVELYLYDSPSEALAKLSVGGSEVFVFDARDYPRYRHILRKFFSLNTDADLVMIGQEAEVAVLAEENSEVAVRSLSAEAKEDEIHEVVLRLVQLRRLREKSGIVGRSRAVDEVLSMIAHAAPLDVNVLILGESGTGKELVARAIHENSPRRKKPFISLNCGAISEGVLESELFGHARGAFTGAVSEHAGVFERADGGTLFLDEVAELPLGMQTRFLRTLETGEYTPVGGRAVKKTNFRLVAATHQDLSESVVSGSFRQDLYYRLRVVVLDTPPLRERKEDIPVLAEAFLAQENEKHGLHVRGLARAAEQALLDHDWPGNVRELRNVISSAVVMKQRGLIELADLPRELRVGPDGSPTAYLPVPHGDAGSPGQVDLGLLAGTLLELRRDIREIKELLTHREAAGFDDGRRLTPADDFVETYPGESGFAPLPGETTGDLQTAERTLVESALKATGGNRRKAANRLGISERTLYRKIKLYGLG